MPRLPRLVLPAAITIFGATQHPAEAFAREPSPTVEATGEPLSVRSQEELFQYTVQEKVGSVQYKDSAGRSAGTADVYQNRTVTGRRVRWRTLQGNVEIPELDFYRIAGDRAAYDRIVRRRRSGVIMAAVGIPMAVVGAGLGVGSYFIYRRGGTWAFYGMSMGGAALMGGGATMAALGFVRLSKSPDRHVLPMEHARQAADAYNQRLGHEIQAPEEPAAEPIDAPPTFGMTVLSGRF